MRRLCEWQEVFMSCRVVAALVCQNTVVELVRLIHHTSTFQLQQLRSLRLLHKGDDENLGYSRRLGKPGGRQACGVSVHFFGYHD